MHNSYLIVIISLFISTSCSSLIAQETKIQLGFYNLENLFDTIDDKLSDDTEFLPTSRTLWNTNRYGTKLDNIASVIRAMGSSENLDGTAILGLCEVENNNVLEQLVRNKHLAELKYNIVHTDSPDKRGIDVALIYQKSHFTVENYRSHTLYLTNPITGERIFTRDQLVVSGKLHGEATSFIVNHWPSRRGGKTKSEPKRLVAAQLTKFIVDSLYAVDSLQNIIIMGDFNDDPNNLSIIEQLAAKNSIDSLNSETLYNPMFDLYQKGDGTLCYRDVWNLFDQIIVNGNLIHNSKVFTFRKAEVFSPEYLKQKEGRYKGYPLRTLAGSKYLGGYSDHFPVYLILGLKK
jgi:endonuclease/exonuclease/phosphatase family metal-dependent hydrolase